MQLARVIGHATSTVKHSSLDGWRLVVTQPLDAAGTADGVPLLAIDDVGCGLGDTVMLTSDGKAVRDLMKTNNSPVRWAIIGISDE